MTRGFSLSADRLQGRLLLLAALFLMLYASALSLSPAARARSWEVDLRWDHWLGVAIWLALFALAHDQTRRRLPGRDPYLLPIAALLSGWGLLTIWRLYPSFGLRQGVWLAISILIFLFGLRLPPDLGFLRRYKYLWLSSGLLLTALTLFLGTNPAGSGPRLWLGCCGIYFQPSEPLKLLLVVYLAAYLAGTRPSSPASSPRLRLLPLLAPTLIMTGLVIALLLAQRDLGTVSIFLFLYTVVVYIASGNRRILLYGFVVLLAAGLGGYTLFDVVRLRVEAWLNPWSDPSGRSYQIVQSLLAIANGGLFGRGPGLGSPTLVPISHSDFIFAAMVEESGLMGALALLVLLALLASRGLRAAFNAADAYRRYLAAGLSAYLVGQSLLIIGGNLRLLPLTGVTLPFVSYGGSSLLTSFLSLLFLLQISRRSEGLRPETPPSSRPYLGLGAFLFAGLAATALASGWWSIYRGPDLLTRADNPRRAISDRSVRRGSILERHNTALAATLGEPGQYYRRVLYPPLSNILGYTHAVYGQSGLEASLDEYLRGLRGNPGLSLWWNHLLYGQPPPGLDVRLSLDIEVQRVADQALGQHVGALVLLNAGNGEILAMASHPTFDANHLDEIWEQLIHEPQSPLLNRATLGRYPLGELSAFLFPQGNATPGLGTSPQIYLPVTQPSWENGDLILSPLHASLAAAALSAGGTPPNPLLVLAVNTPTAGWVILPAPRERVQWFAPETAHLLIAPLAHSQVPIWQRLARAPAGAGRVVTWYVGGTRPEWQGTPLGIAVLLEEDNPLAAEEIGQKVLMAAMFP